jgi:hypothetical protein
MAVSSRVNDGNFSGRALDMYKDYYIEQTRGGKFRIYENADGYSQTSGSVQKKGTVIRRYDPDAGAKEGCVATFASVKDAESYIDRWLTSTKRGR